MRARGLHRRGSGQSGSRRTTPSPSRSPVSRSSSHTRASVRLLHTHTTHTRPATRMGGCWLSGFKQSAVDAAQRLSGFFARTPWLAINNKSQASHASPNRIIIINERNPHAQVKWARRMNPPHSHAFPCICHTRTHAQPERASQPSHQQGPEQQQQQPERLVGSSECTIHPAAASHHH